MFGPDLNDPEALYVITFGPGYGESILVRVPPNDWLAVDSLEIDVDGETVNPALTMLVDRDITDANVVLTHRHKDHIEGMDTLIETQSGFIGYSGPLAAADAGEIASDDAETSVKAGRQEQVRAAIYWRRRKENSVVWDLTRASTRAIGMATITSLHPEKMTNEDYVRAEARDPNALSSPLLLCWNDMHLVLGADLVSTGWDSVAKSLWRPRLDEHAMLKLAHHGSRKDQHTVVIGRTRDPAPCWVATPWNPAKKLPRFENGEGLSELLQVAPCVYLTALPFRPASPINHARPQRRTDLSAACHYSPTLGRRGTLTAHWGQDGWVCVELSPAGDCTTTRGPASVVVVE